MNNVLPACLKDSSHNMVEIPPYLKLVVTQGERRTISAARPATSGKQPPPTTDRSEPSAPRLPLAGDSVELRTGRDPGGDLAMEDYSDPQLAREALEELSRQLPALGHAVHDLHSNLTRGRVLALLAPLTENDPVA